LLIAYLGRMFELGKRLPYLGS